MSFTMTMPVWAQILVDSPRDSKCAPVVSDIPSNSIKHGLVLLAHGSNDPRWRETFERLFAAVRRGTEPVKLAYMEFTGPTLLHVAGECVRERWNPIRILPLFLAAGAHLANDVPELLREVRNRFPGVSVELLPPVGEDPRMVSLMRQIVNEQLQ